jgi:hypothetical protein
MPHTRVFINRNDTIAAAATASAITVAIATGRGFVYIGSNTITALDNEIAQAIGAARTSIAKANYLNSQRFRRGDNDERIDAEGAPGEWLVANLLERSGAALDVAAFVAHKAPKARSAWSWPAVALMPKRLASRPVGTASSTAQHTAKAPDAYLVVHLVDATVIDLFMVRAADLLVAEADGGIWEMRTGFSPHCSCYIRQQLEPLPAAMAA